MASPSIEYCRKRYLKNRAKLLAYAKEQQRKKKTDCILFATKTDEIRAKDRARYYAGRKYTLQAFLRRAKQRASKYKVPFALTVEDLPAIPRVCPIIGLPLKINFGRGGKENSLTLDRIDNSIGYVKGNVAFISMRANRLKCGVTLKEARKLVRYLERHPNNPDL